MILRTLKGDTTFSAIGPAAIVTVANVAVMGVARVGVSILEVIVPLKETFFRSYVFGRVVLIFWLKVGDYAWIITGDDPCFPSLGLYTSGLPIGECSMSRLPMSGFESNWNCFYKSRFPACCCYGGPY